MNLLIRLISPYTEANLLLGVFSTLKEAQTAHTEYISQYKDGKKKDPWKEQAYKGEVDLDEDVVILEDIPEIGVGHNEAEVYIVSTYTEGFGQIIREFNAICGSEEIAVATVSELESKLESNFPEYCEFEKVVVGELLRDERL